MNDIAWGEPPPDTPWNTRLRPFLDRPGEWGRLPGDYAQSTASHLVYAGQGRRKRGSPVIPTGRWEFVASGKGLRPKRVYIWVRYLGPENGS